MERLIDGDVGRELIKELGLIEPYALYNRATRLATGPDDWGDEETVGLFVKRKGTDLAVPNYGQWAGMQRFDDEMQPTILLRNWGSGVRDPVARPGHPVISALVALLTMVEPLSRQIDDMEQRENMRALASRDDLVGLLVFDTIEAMKEQFWLD